MCSHWKCTMRLCIPGRNIGSGHHRPDSVKWGFTGGPMLIRFSMFIWTNTRDFDTYRIGEERGPRRARAYASFHFENRFSSFDSVMQRTRTIWITIKEDNIRFISCKFGQHLASSLGENVLWSNCCRRTTDTQRLVLWFQRRRFVKCLSMYVRGGHLGPVLRTIWISYPLSIQRSIHVLSLIDPVVSE